MGRLFVHQPLFRLLGPLFSGVLAYLLVLLINNAVLSLQDSFLGQELYVCILLSYVTHEVSRFSLIFFQRMQRPRNFLLRLLLQVLGATILTILVVSLTIYYYFRYILLYTPNFRELYVLNSIFVFITLLYVVLYFGHYFLHQRNTRKLENEQLKKMAIESEFQHFRRGINPELLFESLEAILVTMKTDADKAELLCDHFSTVYRYILSKNRRELVAYEEELDMVKELLQLFNDLPFRRVTLKNKVEQPFWLVSTALLTIVEAIVRTTIVSEKKPLQIEMLLEKERLEIVYLSEERLNRHFSLESIPALVKSYGFYSAEPITIRQNGDHKIVQLPKLMYDERSDH